MMLFCNLSCLTSKLSLTHYLTPGNLRTGFTSTSDTQNPVINNINTTILALLQDKVLQQSAHMTPTAGEAQTSGLAGGQM